MMRTMMLAAVKPGMKLANPINQQNFLLGKGARLTAGILERMRRAGIDYVVIAA
jgi:hypothetical protein